MHRVNSLRKSGAFTNEGLPRNGPAHLEKMINSFKNKTRNFSGLPVLVVISDFQENFSGTIDSLFLFDRIKVPIMCVSVAPHNAWNFGIQKAFVSREHPLTVVSIISAQGRPCAQMGVSVVSGAMRSGHGVVSMGADEQATVNIDVAHDRGPNSGGHVSLDIEDPFPSDNVRYFVGEGNKSLRVLVIGDSEKCFPIAAAFRSMQKDGWDPVIAREPRVISFNDIDSADCIVLNEVSFFPRAVQVLIFTRSMGSKAILFSPAIDSASAFAAPDFSNILDKGGKTFAHYFR